MNKKVVLGEWRMATEALRAADVLLREGLYLDSVSRGYYAIFHAAKAVLASAGVHTKRHKELRDKFKKDFVETEKMEELWWLIINKLSEARVSADYETGGDFDFEKTQEANKSAHDFVAKMREYLLGEGLSDEELGGL